MTRRIIVDYDGDETMDFLTPMKGEQQQQQQRGYRLRTTTNNNNNNNYNNHMSTTKSDDVTTTTTAMSSSCVSSSTSQKRRRRRRRRRNNHSQPIVNLVPCVDWKPTEAQLKWAQFRLKRPSLDLELYQRPVTEMDVIGACRWDGDASSEEERMIPSRHLSRGRRALLRVSQRHALDRSRRIRQQGYRMQPSEEDDDEDLISVPSRMTRSILSSSSNHELRLYANGRLICPPAPTDKGASWLVHLPKPMKQQPQHHTLPADEHSTHYDQHLYSHSNSSNTHKSISPPITHTTIPTNHNYVPATNIPSNQSQPHYVQPKQSNNSNSNMATIQYFQSSFDDSHPHDLKDKQYTQSKSNMGIIHYFNSKKMASQESKSNNDTFDKSTNNNYYTIQRLSSPNHSNDNDDEEDDDDDISKDVYSNFKSNMAANRYNQSRKISSSHDSNPSPSNHSVEKAAYQSYYLETIPDSNAPNNHYPDDVSEEDYLRTISSDEIGDSNQEDSSFEEPLELKHYLVAGMYDSSTVIDTDGNLSEVMHDMMLSPTILTKRFQQAVTAIQTHSWDQLAYLFTANPWLAEMVDVRNDQYLLHQLALHPCPHHDLVQTLWEHLPSAAFKLDSQGNLPLHMAAMSGNTHMINLLGSHFSSAASVQNHDGYIPLHLALLTQQSRGVISNLLDLDPSTQDIPDIDGNTPLHLAVLNYKGDVAYDITSLLNDTGTKNNLGQTPMHCALLYSTGWQVVEHLRQGIEDCPNALPMAITGTDPKTVVSIVQMAPKLVSRPDRHGIYPIQLALQRQLPTNVLISMALVDMPGPTWYYLTCQTNDEYLPLVKKLLAKTHQPIRILCSYRGPHRKAVLEQASPKCQKLLLQPTVRHSKP